VPTSLLRAVREPERDPEGSPTLVLLHGLGSSEADLMAFAPLLPPRL
jgi:predicted esterase